MNSRKNPVRLFKNVTPFAGDSEIAASVLERGDSVRTNEGTIRTVFQISHSIDDDGTTVSIKFTNDTFTGTTFPASHVFYQC